MGSNRRRRRRRRGGNQGQRGNRQAQDQPQEQQPRSDRQAGGPEQSRPRRGASSSRREQSARASRPPRFLRLRSTVDSFGGLLTIGAVVIAVGAVVVLIILNRPGGSGSVGDGEFIPPQIEAPFDGLVLGSPDAPVRIIAFEDFNCGHCGDFTRDTKPLLEAEYINAGLVSIEFRHMAILGADSVQASAAAECAAEQNLFWPYHDVLFARQGSAGWASSGNLKDFAREMNDALDGGGLDLAAFDSCVDAGVREFSVRAATEEASQLITSVGGRASTPTFFINGVLAFQGAQPIEVFRSEIDAGLAAAGIHTDAESEGE